MGRNGCRTETVVTRCGMGCPPVPGPPACSPSSSSNPSGASGGGSTSGYGPWAPSPSPRSFSSPCVQVLPDLPGGEGRRSDACGAVPRRASERRRRDTRSSDSGVTTAATLWLSSRTTLRTQTTRESGALCSTGLVATDARRGAGTEMRTLHGSSGTG